MDRMSGFVPTNYGSTAERVPEVGFSGGGSIYDQKEAEALAENVSKIIYTINTERMSLEKSVRLIGTAKDSQELREKMHNILVSIKDKATQVTYDIKLLNNKMRKGGWQQKLQIQKITETFQECIQICKPVEELVVAKMRCHMLPSELAILEQNQEKYSDTDQLTTSEMRHVTEAMEFETGMLKEREEQIAKIAKTVIDINQIMKELGAKVHEQGEDIDRIENAIEDVHVHVTAANEELQKASTYQIINTGITSSVDDTKEDVSIENEDFDITNCNFNNNNNNKDIKDIRRSETGRRKTICILLALSVTIGVILTAIIVVTLHDKKH